MKIPRLAKAIEYIDDDIVLESENGIKSEHSPSFKWWRIVACFVAVVLCVSLVRFYFFDNGNHLGKYKKIPLGNITLGEVSMFLTDDTQVIKAWEDVETMNIMPVYKISHHSVTKTEFEKYADILGFTDYVIQSGTYDYSIKQGDERLTLDNNTLSYGRGGHEIPLTYSDDVLIKQAENIFNSFELEGEYVYSGIGGIKRLTDNSGTYVLEKTFQFSRKMGDILIYGEDLCMISLSQRGLEDVYLTLYDYTQVGSIEMMSLEEAFSKIKTPDNFYCIEDGYKFKEPIDTITINKVFITWNNYFDRGCDIVQPVYNFHGTAKTQDGEKEIMAQIVAIPSKYLYE